MWCYLVGGGEPKVRIEIARYETREIEISVAQGNVPTQYAGVKTIHYMENGKY